MRVGARAVEEHEQPFGPMLRCRGEAVDVLVVQGRGAPGIGTHFLPIFGLL